MLVYSAHVTLTLKLNVSLVGNMVITSAEEWVDEVVRVHMDDFPWMKMRKNLKYGASRRFLN